MNTNRVLVIDKNLRALMPCHPARARQLLTAGRAAQAGMMQAGAGPSGAGYLGADVDDIPIPEPWLEENWIFPDD